MRTVMALESPTNKSAFPSPFTSAGAVTYLASILTIPSRVAAADA
jgi:hypothetical protein